MHAFEWTIRSRVSTELTASSNAALGSAAALEEAPAPKKQGALWAKSSRSEITGENPKLAFSKSKFSKSNNEM
jgi:hypothetical protein